MNQPRFGEVRIITYDGLRDHKVPIRELGQEIVKAQLEGQGVVELSARRIGAGTPSVCDTSLEVKSLSCNDNDTCPIKIDKRPDGRVIASAKGSRFPEACLSCITDRITLSLGFMLEAPQKAVFAAEEA